MPTTPSLFFVSALHNSVSSRTRPTNAGLCLMRAELRERSARSRRSRTEAWSLFQRLPEVRLLQRLFSGIMPRAQIEGLAALNLVNPACEGLVGFRIGGVGQSDEKDGRDALAEALAHGFVADVIFPFQRQ